MLRPANVTDKIVDAFPMEPIGSDDILRCQKRTFLSQITIGKCIILYTALFVELLETQNSFGLTCLR